MPFDVREFPPGERLVARNRRLVGGWLLLTSAMVFVMIVLGGATRLTGSGLSIMEWAPLSGALPPMSEAEWQRLFALYQAIPQYQLLNDGFGIEGFKHIFWLEWTHRLWGRLIGVVFFLPLVILWARGAIERRLVPRLLLLFALGGLQGAVGWFMVASGFFPDSTAVSPYRLVVHLLLALALFAALLWTGLSVLRPKGDAPVTSPRRALAAGLGLLTVTIAAGGFVAGLHAGRIYNTFPLMDGHFVPMSYADITPFWRNLFENHAAVQFDHRLLATATGLFLLATVAIGWLRPGTAWLRRSLAGVGACVAAQYLLGVLTLLAAAPPGLGIAHQAVAVLLFAATLTALHAARAAPSAAPAQDKS
jgi:heme a synthase